MKKNLDKPKRARYDCCHEKRIGDSETGMGHLACGCKAARYHVQASVRHQKTSRNVGGVSEDSDFAVRRGFEVAKWNLKKGVNMATKKAQRWVIKTCHYKAYVDDEPGMTNKKAAEKAFQTKIPKELGILTEVIDPGGKIFYRLSEAILNNIGIYRKKE